MPAGAGTWTVTGVLLQLSSVPSSPHLPATGQFIQHQPAVQDNRLKTWQTNSCSLRPRILTFCQKKHFQFLLPLSFCCTVDRFNFELLFSNRPEAIKGNIACSLKQLARGIPVSYTTEWLIDFLNHLDINLIHTFLQLDFQITFEGPLLLSYAYCSSRMCFLVGCCFPGRSIGF